MPPISRRLPVVAGALGAILLLVIVALFSGTASAAAGASSIGTTANAPSLSYSKTYYGTMTHRPGNAPDVLVLPSSPVGSWWQITTVQLTGHFGTKTGFDQDAFLFTRTVQNPNSYPGLADPNLDVLAHMGIQSGKLGTKVGAGGTGPSPNSAWSWYRFTQPIRLNSEIQIVMGAIIGMGNSVTVTVNYANLGSGTTIVEYGANLYLKGGALTFRIAAPAGKSWYLMNAFADIKASSSGSRSILIRTSTGMTLDQGSNFPVGVLVRCTGGYSTVQTGPALNRYGTQTVWGPQVSLYGTEYITAQFTGPATAQAMWVLVFTQV